MTQHAVIVPLCVAVPLCGAFFTALAGRRLPGLPDALGLGTTICTLAMGLACMYVVASKGPVVYAVGGWPSPTGITMVLDALTAFMLVTVNLVALAGAFYSIDYMERFTCKWQFYTLFLLMLAGMNGVVVTGDMFNLFVFLEVAAVASYALVAFGAERHELEAAFKYAVMGTLGSLCILMGIAFLYGHASTLNMNDMAEVLASGNGTGVTLFVGVLFLMGFGMKSAAVPFHAWLPDAHPSAPAPISALLSGVLIKSLGVYALCRVFYNVLGFTGHLSSVLLVLGVVSMVAGVVLAIGQWDIKRLLAYHSISQIGYILLGLGLGTPLGIFGGLFHLFNHSVFKSLLFLCAGAIEYSTGTRDLRKMGGLAEKMPLTGLATLVGSLSIAGIPPFNGFWSKLFIIIAAVEAGRPGYASWAVLASILTLASFTKVMKYAFGGKTDQRWANTTEVPALMLTPMLSLSAVCVLGGLMMLPNMGGAFLTMASEVLSQGVEQARLILGEAD